MGSRTKQLDGWTSLALVTILIVYPVLYCSGFIGPMVRQIFAGDRLGWWQFHLANLAFHWVPFGLVWWALKRNGESWNSIGVDWAWFWRQRYWLFLVFGLLVAAAFVMPGVLYGGELPRKSESHFMAPVSTAERLMMIVVAITAGVTEEVLFRGFSLTRLSRLVNVWLALFATVISFLFIHGVPRDQGILVAYTAAGLAFGVPFILMGLRRLEILILIHFAIDASMILAP